MIQWFTESQFEAYRELGRHIGKTVFKHDWDWLQRCPHDPEAEKSSSPSTLDEKIERLAVLLIKRWYTPSASVRSAFSKHGEAMNELFGRLSQDEDLKFLDGQLYPQWPDLTKEKDKTSPPTKTVPLPTDPKEFRKGFDFFCNQIFQLNGKRLCRPQFGSRERSPRQSRLDEHLPQLGVVANAPGRLGDERRELRRSFPNFLRAQARPEGRQSGSRRAVETRKRRVRQSPKAELHR